MSGIGEFVPGRHRFIPDTLLLVIGFGEGQVLCADTEGNLTTFDIGEVSIDWHYDPGDGRWKPDFEDG